MGKVVKILGKKEISSSPNQHSERLITEENKNDESIHVHLRNLRLVFSKDEFVNFAEHVRKSSEALQKQTGINADDGREGTTDSYFILDQKKIEKSPNIDKEKLQVELNESNNLHLHYRDLRIDLTSDELKEFIEVLNSALTDLDK